MSVSKGVRVGPATTDTCPWRGTDIEYHSNCDGPREEWPPEEEARVWLTCPNEDCPVQPSTLVCKTLEEADAAWARRPTTRDAALREEGRAEGLREAKRAVASVPVFGRPTKWGEGYNMGVADSHGAVARLLAQQPSPDASQGSARPGGQVNESAPLPAINEGRGPGPAAPQGSVFDGERVPRQTGEQVSLAAKLVETLKAHHVEYAHPLTRDQCGTCEMIARWDYLAAAPQGSPLPGGEASGVTRPPTEDEITLVAQAMKLCPWSGMMSWNSYRNLAEVAWKRAVELLNCSDATHGHRDVKPDNVQPRNPPEGRALEGELAEALRAVVVGNTCMRYRCDEGCRCSLGHARRALARYDASKAIPQSGTVKEGTDGK